MFWTKQALWCSVFLFVVVVAIPYIDFVLGWLFLASFVLFTWVSYNQPVDETGTIDGRSKDFRIAFVGLGVLFFSIGYFRLGNIPGREPYAIAFGLASCFLPMIVVEACRPRAALERGFDLHKVFDLMLPPVVAVLFAGGAAFAGSLKVALCALMVGQLVQLGTALWWDFQEYAKNHATNWFGTS